MDPLRCSKWKVLVRTVACAYRFASNCRRKRDDVEIEAVSRTARVKEMVKKEVRSTVVPLKRESYRKAEAFLWRAAQSDHFEDEIRTLKKNQ